MRILIVEDEKGLALVLSEMLNMEGYYTDIAYDGESGLDNALSGLYDIIVLDIMLPKMDGISVLREMRRENISSAVLLLTAKSQIEDKVEGLDSGADDYLTKPFITDEFLARIRALSRRKHLDYVSGILQFADFSIDPSGHELKNGKRRIKLSKKEYDILEMLVLNKGQRISKDRFISKIWGYDSDVEYNSIEVYISFLRKKLAAVHSCVKIVTARGLGYALEVGESGQND